MKNRFYPFFSIFVHICVQLWIDTWTPSPNGHVKTKLYSKTRKEAHYQGRPPLLVTVVFKVSYDLTSKTHERSIGYNSLRPKIQALCSYPKDTLFLPHIGTLLMGWPDNHTRLSTMQSSEAQFERQRFWFNKKNIIKTVQRQNFFL